MFYGIKYLIVTLVFSHLGFWSGNLFLIASFPDLCLLVPFSTIPYHCHDTLSLTRYRNKSAAELSDCLGAEGGGSHMRPRTNFVLALHGECLHSNNYKNAFICFEKTF